MTMPTVEDKANQIVADMQKGLVAIDPATLIAIISLIIQIIKIYQGCKKSAAETASAMKEPTWWQRWRLRRLTAQAIRESGTRTSIDEFVESLLKHGRFITVEEVEKMYKELS